MFSSFDLPNKGFYLSVGSILVNAKNVFTQVILITKLLYGGGVKAKFSNLKMSFFLPENDYLSRSLKDKMKVVPWFFGSRL